MSVEAIMTQSVLSVGPSATVREAIRLLEDSEIRHLLVVEDGQLVGIVSDRDLREYRIPLMLEVDADQGSRRAEALLDTAVSEVMSSDVVAVDSSETVLSVIDAMIEYKVGAVPVIDRHSDELLGIVSYVDVLRYVRELLVESED